jgi:hypothetical protein
MKDAPPANSLSYATPLPQAQRPRGWGCVALFLAAGMLPGPVLLAGSRMPHDAICPSCGGWGAAALIALMAAFAALAIWTTVQAIRHRARIVPLILACLACVLACAYLAAAIGLYFAIQA